MKRLEVGPFGCIGCNRPAPVSLASEWLGRFPMYRWAGNAPREKNQYRRAPGLACSIGWRVLAGQA